MAVAGAASSTSHPMRGGDVHDIRRLTATGPIPVRREQADRAATGPASPAQQEGGR